MVSELISVIVPCYNESRTVEIFYKEITKVSSEMDKYDFEYIFVDDGSKDDTLNTSQKPISSLKTDLFISAKKQTHNRGA